MSYTKNMMRTSDFLLSENGTKIWYPELSNINREAIIGANCVIHSHVWIGRGVKIGDNCKIEALCFLPDGVELKDNVFLGPGVIFTNDKYPPSGGSWSKTTIEKGVSIGANATILPGIVIGEGAKIGAGAVVTKNVEPEVVMVGNPAKKLEKHE